MHLVLLARLFCAEGVGMGAVLFWVSGCVAAYLGAKSRDWRGWWLLSWVDLVFALVRREIMILHVGLPFAVLLALAGCSGEVRSPAIGASSPSVEVAPRKSADAPAAAERASLSDAWLYDEVKDEMRGKSRYTAALVSENKVNLPFPYDGGVGMRVLLRDDPEYGKDVMLVVDKGQLPCYAYDGCSFKVKFDNGSIQRFSASGAENGASEVLFVSGQAGRKRFMAGLRKAKKMVIEVTMYDAGRQQFVFGPSGLQWERF